MSSRSTVFLIPGLTGTQLRDCVTNQLLWLNPELMMDCPASLIEYLDIHYDKTTKSFTSIRGVAASGDIGDLRAIKMISEPPMCAGGQFEQLVNYLVHVGGYKEGTDLFGIPYDWRLILDQTYWSTFSHAVKEEIEKHSGGCSSTRSTLICLSMGTLVAVRFLRDQTPEWRTRYIRRVIFVAGPLGGCPKAFISICGAIEDIPGYNTPCVRKFIQRCSGAFMCHPMPDCFPNLRIIRNISSLGNKCKKMSFTVDEIEKTYEHPCLNVKSALEIYRDYGQWINKQTAYGIGDDVELHIVYSSARDTTVGLDYAGTCDNPTKIRESEYYRELFPGKCRRFRMGDGMIPNISLAYWNTKKYPSGKPYVSSVKCFTGYQYEHADILNRTNVIQYIFSLLDVSCLDLRLTPVKLADVIAPKEDS
jgi:hypothetical protein